MSGVNLTQSLVQKLGSSIVRGELPAGKSLPIEAELGKKFGASRTLMREGGDSWTRRQDGGVRETRRRLAITAYGEITWR